MFSGGGLHGYWLFKEAFATQDGIERLENAMRQLADLVGGDLQVCEVSRVLRLPGSHNTKDGAWTEVEVMSLYPERRYELDDLEEWLAETSPIILRKQRPLYQSLGESDVWQDYVKMQERKPPVDVEKRLSAMGYMAGGDSSIHGTQLSVTASLLNSGTPIDEVVELVLKATQVAAGDYGKHWNWKREETQPAAHVRELAEEISASAERAGHGAALHQTEIGL